MIIVGAKPQISISGTSQVNIVGWDSTVSIPAGTALIGRVIINSITGTNNVAVVNTPTITGTVSAIGLSGSVSVIAAPAISGSVSVINTPTITGSVSVIAPTAWANGGTAVYNGTSTAVGYAQIIVTTSANAIIVTSAASKQIVVLSLWLNMNGPNSATFFSATTAIGGPVFAVTSGGGLVLNRNQDGWFRTTAGQSLTISLASSGVAGGSLTYVVVG